MSNICWTPPASSSYLRDRRLTFVDLNHDDVAWTTLRSHFTGLDRIALPVELLRADFIVSMPKLKTHHWAVITAGMKNLFGVVPGAVYGWPKNVLHAHGIDNSILDLAATDPHRTSRSSTASSAWRATVRSWADPVMSACS